MAKNLNGADGAAVHEGEAHDAPEGGRLSNGEARKAAIREGFAERHRIEQDIERLKEQHIKPLQDERKKLMRNLKADTDISRKVLDAEYKLYKIAADSQSFENEDEGDGVLDDLREVHSALHPGDQLDWVAAINGEYGEPAQQAAE